MLCLAISFITQICKDTEFLNNNVGGIYKARRDVCGIMEAMSPWRVATARELWKVDSFKPLIGHQTDDGANWSLFFCEKINSFFLLNISTRVARYHTMSYISFTLHLSPYLQPSRFSQPLSKLQAPIDKDDLSKSPVFLRSWSAR